MNWFRFRLPNTAEIFCGASLRLEKGLGNGFVVAPFCNPEEGMLTIPNDFIPDETDLHSECSEMSQSTPKEDYLNEVSIIIKDLNGNRGKTVAARIIRIECAADIIATFNALCSEYPDAFVFTFSTSETGTWIGASPELLLKKDGTRVSTVALAGTRPAFSEEDWDEKNIEEQSMVVEFIKKCLEENCFDVQILPRYTKRAGKVEHLCTPLTAEINEPTLKISEKITELLTSLSPTPAICGSSREKSLKLITELENFPREMYGGFCGPNNINGNIAFYVILRVAKCNPEAVCVYSGGG
ncbi:MAG: chorismate-binding protein, partial [Muribaculaceae bacterium]|nr:chorismate-binding protein [Muribaculaceae bacterium]